MSRAGGAAEKSPHRCLWRRHALLDQCGRWLFPSLPASQTRSGDSLHPDLSPLRPDGGATRRGPRGSTSDSHTAEGDARGGGQGGSRRNVVTPIPLTYRSSGKGGTQARRQRRLLSPRSYENKPGELEPICGISGKFGSRILTPRHPISTATRGTGVTRLLRTRRCRFPPPPLQRGGCRRALWGHTARISPTARTVGACSHWCGWGMGSSLRMKFIKFARGKYSG